jgi:hypothetical protein
MKRVAVAAGFTIPIVFTALVGVQGALQPDYDQIAMPISALEAWPLGWIQRLNFFIYGALLLVFVLGLDRAIARTRWGGLATALLVICAIGGLLAGAFPWVRTGGEVHETPGHVVAAISHFAGAALGSIALSRRMARDEAWRSLSTYVLLSGVALLALFIAFGAFAIRDDAPLHAWAGLLQRIIVAIWFGAIFVLARRLSRAPAR